MTNVTSFIGGQYLPAKGESWDHPSAVTGQKIFTLFEAGPNDVAAAVGAASDAFHMWSKLAARERSAKLRALSNLIIKNADQLARLESEDTGKPLKVAREIDIPRAAYNFEFFADLLTGFESESHASAKTLNFTLREPLGPVACISPWNLPLYLLTWKLAPALASGCTVVAKPSEWTPRTAAMLGDLSIEAGIPKGVLNIVQGRGAVTGSALVNDARIKAVSFTGSTNTGQKIAADCAPTFKKLALEMGGKNPALVFADADIDLVVQKLVRAAFLNSGQICLCASRIYVDGEIYEQFKERFVAAAKKLVLGDPQVDGTDIGPLVSKAHFDKVIDRIALARREGGQILCGGDAPKVSAAPSGLFVSPTVIEGLPLESRTNQDEIFGPVVTIAKFAAESEAIMLANGTHYGLAATVFTKDINRALRLARQLEFGIVWVNTWMNRDLRTPFGGVKNSGLSREGGFEGLKFFTEAKNVCIEIEELV
jgi:aminomuconate-semialdehyde/2-hydroxymuconate-6-semialdehyde dehydrogenase